MIKVILDVKSEAISPAVIVGELPCNAYRPIKGIWVPTLVNVLVELQQQMPRLTLAGSPGGVNENAFSAVVDQYHFTRWAEMVAMWGPSPRGTWIDVPALGISPRIGQYGTLEGQRVKAQKSPLDDTWVIEGSSGGTIQLTDTNREIWYQDLTTTINLCAEIINYVEHRRAAERTDLLTGISNLITISML